MSLGFYYKTVGNLRYTESQVLGKGGFAKVYTGHYLSVDYGKASLVNVQVAVKKISLYEEDPRVVEAELAFFEVSKNVQHENLVKYLAKEEDDEYLYIAMDLCEMTLEDFIAKLLTNSSDEPHWFSLGPHLEILRQTTAGLHYLHSKKIVHLDLKPQNVLITDGRVVKLSDFGLCQTQNDGADGFTNRNAAGTEGWKAPEFYKGSMERFDGYSADIFSLGCVFGYSLTMGDHPFGLEKHRAANIQAGKLDWRKSITLEDRELRTLVIKMVSLEPSDRPSLEMILFKLVERLLAVERTWQRGLMFYELFDRNMSEKDLTTAELMDRLINTLTYTRYEDGNGRCLILLFCRTFKKTRLECIEKLFSCEERFKFDVSSTGTASNHNALTYVLESATEEDDDIVKMAELLIKKDINVNVKTTNGDTALGLAIKYFSRPGSPDRGLVDMLKLLLDHGANPNDAANKDGLSPVALACKYYHKDDLIDALKLLVDKGARLDRSAPGGNDAFVYVRQYYQGANRAAINSLLVEASQTSADAMRGSS